MKNSYYNGWYNKSWVLFPWITHYVWVVYTNKVSFSRISNIRKFSWGDNCLGEAKGPDLLVWHEVKPVCQTSPNSVHFLGLSCADN